MVRRFSRPLIGNRRASRLARRRIFGFVNGFSDLRFCIKIMHFDLMPGLWALFIFNAANSGSAPLSARRRGIFQNPQFPFSFQGIVNFPGGRGPIGTTLATIGRQQQ
ncbi:MAG TPA: hypothetical protein ENK15_09080 [Thermopetrobacter sp.]|nr:hypothetical protein [Thermopetrobacter sp.]